MRSNKIIILIFLFITSNIFAQNKGVIFGVVKDEKNKPIENITVSIEGTSINDITDKNGKYRIETIPTGKEIILVFTELSYQTKRYTITLENNEVKNINPNLKLSELEEVVVKYNKKDEEREQVSMFKMDARQTESLPSVFGDFSKVLATLPGVSTNSELSTTYSVRGGNFDENLVYVNGMPIYRPFIVSTGQQEGLSFVNSNLTSDVEFSAGGWQPKYGDKLSSVLSIQYKTPTKFAGSATAGLLGGSTHIEGASKDKKFTYVAGLRYKDSRWILKRLDTGAEFRPWFIDFQSYMTYDLTNKEKHPEEIKTTIGLLTSYAKNSYLIIPEFKETNFGTFNDSKRLNIAFEGQERMTYDAYQNGLKLDHNFTDKIKMNLILSNLYTVEREFFDVESGYRLCDVSLDPSADNFNKCVFTQDIGTEYKHGRNKLEAEIYNLRSNWEYEISGTSTLEWGANYSNENITDVVDEYRFEDSTGYVALTKTLFDTLNLSSHRVGAFFQHSLLIDSNIVFTYGVRSSYWTINREITLSPRTQLSYTPNWKRNVLFKMAAGVYHQPPFYRELRNDSAVLNKKVKAQASTHIIAGMDYNFKMWKRDFKLTSEIYHKQIFNAITYDIDDVKLRYKAKNNADAYAYGADFRISGEFIKNAESWFSLGILRTREKLYNDKFIGVDDQERNAGYVPRPTDQLLIVGIFFQDHLPKNPTWKMYLNVNFGSGLPFSPPGVHRHERYSYQGEFFNTQTGRLDTGQLSSTTIGRFSPYRRVDIGLSKLIAFNVDDNVETKGIRSILLSLEVLNAIEANNTISYTWVTDLYGTQYAIPNFLSARLFNIKAIVKF